jgi:acyl carrier protein
MLPSAFVVLPALPLGPNGKVDRGLLPEPEPAAERSHEPPLGDTEQVLAAIWAELLGLDAVGRRDNFFELGGHSLLLLKLRRKLEDVLGARPSIVDLFRYPTIESLGAFIARPDGAGVGMQDVEERARRQRGSLLGRKAAAERLTR